MRNVIFDFLRYRIKKKKENVNFKYNEYFPLLRVMPFQPIFKVSKLLALCENKYRGDTLKYLKYQNLSLSKYYDEYQHWTQCRKKTNELHKTWCKIIKLGFKIVMQGWIKPSIYPKYTQWRKEEMPYVKGRIPAEANPYSEYRDILRKKEYRAIFQ